MGSWLLELPGRVLGPMFALDAVRAGRRTSTFVARGLFLLGLGFVLFMFFSSTYSRFRGATLVNPKILAGFAEDFFWVYATTQFVIVCVLTPAFTAAAITDEKERKTLDFLLVTAMSAREIIVGKLGARVGVLVTFVLAGLPVLSLIQFFGGIDPRFVLIAAAMTLASILSLSALGVACSVALPRTREAVVLTYALPAGYLYVSYWAWWNAVLWPTIAARGGGAALPGVWTDLAEVVAAGNPFVFMMKAGRGSGGGFGDAFSELATGYAVFHLVFAAIGVAFAAARLRGVARKAGAVGAKPRGRVGRLYAMVTGRRTAARKHPPVGDDPIYWREVHVDPGSGTGLLRRGLALGVLAAVVFPFLAIVADTILFPSSSRRFSRWGTYDPWVDFQDRTKMWACVVTGALGTLMLLRAAVRGAGAVAGEKDRDTWTGLIGTPLGTNEILRGKWYGCFLGQWDAIYLLLAVWSVGIFTRAVNPLAAAMSAGALALYLGAFSWLGIACSVTARNTRIAIARAVPLAVLGGGGFWVVFGCLGGCCMMGGDSGGGRLMGYIAAFLAGFTPPVMLGGLSALEFSYMEDVAKASARDGTAITSLVCGAFFGTGVWYFILASLRERATALFNAEANRNTGYHHTDPDEPREPPWFRQSSPGRPPAGPPGSSGGAEPS